MVSVLFFKIKLLFRNNYDTKIKINYLLVFLIAYLFFLYNAYISEQYFATIFLFTALIIGLDYHTVINGTHLKTTTIYCSILDKHKSIKLNLFSDLIIKLLLLAPVYFILYSHFILSVVYFLVFSVFSFIIKDLTACGFLNKKNYLLLIFFYIFATGLFGGFTVTNKTMMRLDYINQHFNEIYVIILFVYITLDFVLWLYFIRNFGKRI